MGDMTVTCDQTTHTSLASAPFYEASYAYQSYYGSRSHRLGLFDSPEAAFACLSEEAHLSDGEIHEVQYTFGFGRAGERSINEGRRIIYGERLNPDTNAIERGWLNLHDVDRDPDYLRLLELRETFAPFLVWRERFENVPTAHAIDDPPMFECWEARGERDPENGIGGSQSLGRFDSIEQAIEQVQHRGLGGEHGFVVHSRVYDNQAAGPEALKEHRVTVWGKRKNFTGPGYEYGFCDYRDYYELDLWHEFTRLSARFSGK